MTNDNPTPEQPAPMDEARIADIEVWLVGEASMNVTEPDDLIAMPHNWATDLIASWREQRKRIDELEAELQSLEVRHLDLARYAVHLGDCKFMEDPDVCTCALAAHSEVLGE